MSSHLPRTAFLNLLALLLITATAHAQIKYVYSIDYPVGGKAAYLEWIGQVGSTLQAPKELVRIASYDNYFTVSPHRIVEFEFADMASAAAYFARPEIARVLDDLVNHSANSELKVLKARGDYTKAGRTLGPGSIKQIHAVAYPLARKEAYLTWARSVTTALQAPEEVVRIRSWDDYFGSSPQRIIEFEFDSLEDAGRYYEHPDVMNVFDHIGDHGMAGAVTVLKLRGDYNR